jgi:carbamoyltransferase
MLTLGINAVYHDSAACIVRDGEVIAAVEEERFTRKKHAKRPIPFSTYELPYNSIDYCLKEAGVTLKEVDHVAYSYDPFLLLRNYSHNATISLPLEPSAHPTPAEWEAAWDPLFLSSIVNAPRQLIGGAPHHLQVRFRGTPLKGAFEWHFVEHHLAHAASAFLPSPFEEAAILTIDGRGEQATTVYAHGDCNEIQMIGQVNMPNSLGMLYERATEYLGFLTSSDEYKVMALASFGKPAYQREFREMVQILKDGLYVTRHEDLVELFGPARLKGEPLEQRHYDLAHSLQMVLEETALELADWLYGVTGLENLCMAGGVALNCVMNSCIRDQGKFKHVWVQPAAGDAGTALGAAMWIDARQRHSNERTYRMDHAFLGPGYSDEEIESFLRWSKLPYRRMENVAEETADLLTKDQIIGWFQGRHEFGPRALGGRSILASPIHADMQERLNEIKDREDFRPVAPVVLEEAAPEWFVDAGASPFMLFVYDVVPEKATLIPAVRHVDGTARIQTINRSQNEAYYDLIKAFQRRTGVPVLVNTSFNTRGEPIVCSPRDALECFWTSPLDALVMGPFLLQKPVGTQ